MSVRTFLIAALLMAAFVAPDAHADDALPDYLAAAAAYWHATPPCASGVQTETEEPAPPVTAEAGAWVDPGDHCLIHLTPYVRELAARWGSVRACDVVVHEWGHLLGYGHSDDPGDVMFPTLDLPVGRPRTATCTNLEHARQLAAMADHWSRYGAGQCPLHARCSHYRRFQATWARVKAGHLTGRAQRLRALALS